MPDPETLPAALAEIRRLKAALDAANLRLRAAGCVEIAVPGEECSDE